MYKKVEAVMYVIGLLLWFLGSQLLVSNSISFVVNNLGMDYMIFYNEHMYAIHISAQILCISILLLWDYKGQVFLFKEGGPLSGKLVIKYILGGIGVWFLSTLINGILLPYFPDYENINELFVNDERIVRFIVLVIGSPLVEEYIFRGKIQGHLKEQFGRPIAIVGQALLFGSLHALALQKIYATVIGMVFGWVREREGHIKSTVIMHMTVNFIGWLIGSFLS